MSVVTFPGVNYNDVPAMLRAMADQIESGEYGAVRGLAQNMVMETMGDIE